MTTGIQWTEKTWNPVTGCSKVSRGCKHCYAEGMAKRIRGMARAARSVLLVRPLLDAQPESDMVFEHITDDGDYAAFRRGNGESAYMFTLPFGVGRYAISEREVLVTETARVCRGEHVEADSAGREIDTEQWYEEALCHFEVALRTDKGLVARKGKRGRRGTRAIRFVMSAEETKLLRDASVKGAQGYEGVLTEGGLWNGKLECLPERLKIPLGWKRPQMVFVNSMSDLFHEDVPDEFIDKVFDVMWSTPRHTYQVLTKRPERMVKYVLERAYRREFGWTDLGRPAMKPGTIIHFDDIVMRNMCGYIDYECEDEDIDYPCKHSTNEDGDCNASTCPIASTVFERSKLEEIGVEDQYEYNKYGEAEDCFWMELHGRPLHAACSNVWLGFSAENQERYELGIREFRQLREVMGPEFTLFASLEPLLGPLDFVIPYYAPSEGEKVHPWNSMGPVRFSCGGDEVFMTILNWAIVGAESGKGAGEFRLEWLRDIQAKCEAAGVALFVKQLGKRPIGLDGETIRMAAPKGKDMSQWPEWCRVREFPGAGFATEVAS